MKNWKGIVHIIPTIIVHYSHKQNHKKVQQTLKNMKYLIVNIFLLIWTPPQKKNQKFLPNLHHNHFEFFLPAKLQHIAKYRYL